MPSEDTDAYDVVDDHGARRRRAIITFAIVSLLLFFAFWYALSYIRADDARRAQPSAGRSPMCTLEPADITVNVFNGTKREGLAASVSGNLRKRGFVIGTVGNAKSAVAGAGEIDMVGHFGVPFVGWCGAIIIELGQVCKRFLAVCAILFEPSQMHINRLFRCDGRERGRYMPQRENPD